MKPGLQIQIPTPCHEHWDKMNPTEQGRFCLSCKKEVIDFSLMTDKEILNYISKANKQTCGRFGNEQLNRELVVPSEPRKIWWKYWMSVAASLIMLSSKSSAQVKVKGEPIVCTPSNYSDQIVVGKLQVNTEVNNDSIRNGYTVNGVIKDERDNPVPGASVVIKHTRQAVSADRYGKFTIKINDAKSEVLSISSVGYDPQEIIVKNNANSVVTVNLKMHESVMGLGEVVIVKKKRRTFLKIFNPYIIKSVKPATDPILKVYPNPVVAGSAIKLKMDALANGKYILSVSDMNGNPLTNKEIIITTKTMDEVFNCDNRFKSGMYVLKMIGNGKTIVSKLMVQ
jgi:CarboxypepD_reg-like domain